MIMLPILLLERVRRLGQGHEIDARAAKSAKSPASKANGKAFALPDVGLLDI